MAAVLAFACAAFGAQAETARNVDFRNFTYPFPLDGDSLFSVDRVEYGYVTSGKQVDAVAALEYPTGGAGHWHYVYTFSFASGTPKLIGCSVQDRDQSTVCTTFLSRPAL